MSADAERDPVEWAQHSALVAISVFRTVLDLAEAAVADRERLERLATTGRSFAESWIGDATRLASTMAAGFGFDSAAAPAASPAPAARAEPPGERPPSPSPGSRAGGPPVAKRPAKRAAPKSRATPVKKKAATTRKTASTRPKPRKK
ncbi:MAG: hypothetical protein ABI658_01895 [Acidimicrobiales bacterium]